MAEKLTTGVIRGGESWAFFAFVFAALVGLTFALIGELPTSVKGGWRALMKLASFVILGYLTLGNAWMQNQLVGLMNALRRVGL